MFPHLSLEKGQVRFFVRVSGHAGQAFAAAGTIHMFPRPSAQGTRTTLDDKGKRKEGILMKKLFATLLALAMLLSACAERQKQGGF